MIKLQVISKQYKASRAIVRPLSAHRTKLLISTHAGHQIISKHNIDFVKADGNYCEIHANGGKKFVCSKTLKDLAGRLNDPRFARIHQSYLVNLHAVSQINSNFSELILENGISLPISRSNRGGLRARMTELFD